MRRCVAAFALLLFAAAIVRAAGTLRIVPIVRGDSVVVSIELKDAYTSEVRDAIASGLRTTFTYDVELRMEVAGWVDRTIATTVVTTSDHYDNLTRVHRLSRTINGRVEQSLLTDKESVARDWLTSLATIPLARTSRLDPHREYYVRISARVRPPGSSLLGLASTVSSQAKFTFIP